MSSILEDVLNTEGVPILEGVLNIEVALNTEGVLNIEVILNTEGVPISEVAFTRDSTALSYHPLSSVVVFAVGPTSCEDRTVPTSPLIRTPLLRNTSAVAYRTLGTMGSIKKWL